MLKLKNTKRVFKKSEKGMALVETIPVLFMLVLVFNFSLGFFGAIHSGILNSIGSYNYAIETFRYRSNLMYFRPGDERSNYKLAKSRVHGVTKDGSDQTVEDKARWPATVRPITFNYVKETPAKTLTVLANGSNGTVCDDAGCRTFDKSGTENVWNVSSTYVPQTGTAIQTPRIWVKTVYGMCLNADCK